MDLPWEIVLKIFKELSSQDLIHFLLATGRSGQDLINLIPPRSFPAEPDHVLVLISSPGLRYGGNPAPILFNHRVTSTLPDFPWVLPTWMKGLIAQYRPQSAEAVECLKRVLRVYKPSSIVLMGDPPPPLSIRNVLFKFVHPDIEMLRSSSEEHFGG